MQPDYTFSDVERDDIRAALAPVCGNPYRDYLGFVAEVEQVVAGGLPPTMLKVAEHIRDERADGVSDVHALRNCPVDTELPDLSHGDPQADKYARKTTFTGEAFLAAFAFATGTPLLAYATRFNGDFFTDVFAIDRYSGKQTGYSDGELVFHNDRTAHPVRADFITLLGLRCPPEELTYTGFVDGRDLLAGVGPDMEAVLRQPHFVTPFDVVSRDNNAALTASEPHAVFENHHSIRYLDTHTTVAPDAPDAAKDALLALKNALARAERRRHRILQGDLFTFANQDGLHNRELIEVVDPARSRSRWLLKTYAFRNAANAERHAERWLDGIPGRVGD